MKKRNVRDCRREATNIAGAILQDMKIVTLKADSQVKLIYLIQTYFLFIKNKLSSKHKNKYTTLSFQHGPLSGVYIVFCTISYHKTFFMWTKKQVV